MAKELQPCGTSAAYRRHKKRNEEPCDLCKEAQKLKSRLHDEKRRDRIPNAPFDESKCGTTAGYSQHKRHSVPPCESCLQANRDYHNARNRRLGRQEFQPAECGTVGGYRRHHANDEKPCGPCAEAYRVKRREQTGAQPFKPAACGTRSGYWRHYHRGEEACAPCKAALASSSGLRKFVGALFRDQDGHCALCGLLMDADADALHVDHRLPVSLGGTDDYDNLQLVHARCNMLKGNLPNDEALAKIACMLQEGRLTAL